MTGRPSTFTQDAANAIFARLIKGRSITSICDDDDMPNFVTLLKWFPLHKKFREQYTLACLLGARPLTLKRSG